MLEWEDGKNIHSVNYWNQSVSALITDQKNMGKVMIFPGDVYNFNYLTGVGVRQIFQADEKQKQPPEVLYKKRRS